MQGSRIGRTAMAVVFAAIAVACSDDISSPATSYVATLRGSNEVPPLSVTGTGSATLTLTGTTLAYTITVSGLTGDARQSHIHLANAGANGAVSIWLCDSATNPSPDASTPACTAGTGAITLATGSVSNLTEAQIGALNGFGAYVNVHTAANGGGEIRGQAIPQ